MSAKAPSARGLAFADWFRRELTLPALRTVANWREQWALCFDAMVRLDHREELEISMVCRWGRGEPAVRGASVSAASLFWKKNFQTPLKLRDRNGQKVMFYDVFAEAMYDELGAGPSLAGVTLCHTAFCEAAKAAVPVRFYGAHWRALLESPEYDGDAARLADDVRHVVWFISRGIGESKRNVGALKLATLLEPRRFFEERADARKHGRGYFQTAAGKSAPALPAPNRQAALPAPVPALTEEDRKAGEAFMEEFREREQRAERLRGGIGK